jgi:hypothetical protein
MEINTKEIPWFEVEGIVRNLDHESSVRSSSEAFLLIDIVKTSLIALMGSKLFNDSNEVFSYNMQVSLEESLHDLTLHFPSQSRSLAKIKKFVEDNLA